MKPLSPNTLLQNRYLIVQLIGKGGMGEVYLAVDQRLGSAVALKRTFFSDDETLGSAFEREARTLARLRHPALPKVSDHFTENDTQYLVMEHISGDDLSKRLEVTRRAFPLNWVLFWADQLLDALAYLHSHEPPIIHRDIKPQNLKLTNENHIILLDFGLAKNTSDKSRVSTTGGSIVGYTPHYAPMEQIRGTGTNPKSDIYSLAATLYQLLTAQIPADALTRADSLLNSLPDPVEPIDKINPEIPRAVSDVILKGMALSMEQRYASARDMQKALREAYAQLQNKMGAETMAFNLPAQQQQEQGVLSVPPQSPPPQQRKIEAFATPLVSNPQSQTPTEKYNSLSSGGQRTDSFNNAPPPPQPNFDLTMRDESLNPTSLPPSSHPSNPSQQKTEVLPAGGGGDNVSAAPPSNPKPAQQNFNPETTVPLISFDQNQPPLPPPPATQYQQTGGASQPQQQQQSYGAPNHTAPAATAVATAAGGGRGGRTHTENAFQPAPLYAAETRQKSGGGKGLAVAGILGGFGLVAVAAAGIGLYAFGDKLGITGGGGAAVTPTPTASPVVSATPTASPTVERANTGTNTTGSNSAAAVNQTVANADAGNVNAGNSTAAVAGTTNRATVPPPARTPVPQATRVVQTAPPVVRNTPPVVVRTPKPQTPKPGGRTDILQ
jgi:serine/threonine protein kinase